MYDLTRDNYNFEEIFLNHYSNMQDSTGGRLDTDELTTKMITDLRITNYELCGFRSESININGEIISLGMNWCDTLRILFSIAQKQDIKRKIDKCLHLVFKQNSN